MYFSGFKFCLYPSLADGPGQLGSVFLPLTPVVSGLDSRRSVERRHRGALGRTFSLSSCRGSASVETTHCFAKGLFFFIVIQFTL